MTFQPQSASSGCSGCEKRMHRSGDSLSSLCFSARKATCRRDSLSEGSKNSPRDNVTSPWFPASHSTAHSPAGRVESEAGDKDWHPAIKKLASCFLSAKTLASTDNVFSPCHNSGNSGAVIPGKLSMSYATKACQASGLPCQKYFSGETNNSLPRCLFHCNTSI